MPSRSTVLRWLTVHPEFRVQYTLARQLQAELRADEIVDIADGVAHGATKEEIWAAQLRVKTRQWTAEKLLSAVYGQKRKVEHRHIMERLPAMTDEELESLQRMSDEELADFLARASQGDKEVVKR